MPSFFEGMKRLITGKPVFDEQDNQSGNFAQPQPVAPPTVAPPVVRSPKVVPQVTIQRVDCRLNGENMDCNFYIRNDSQVRVELDKIRLLKTVDEIDDHLDPGETQEFRVYSGPRPRDTYLDDIELVYKDQSGNYFEARHLIEFQKQNDGTHVIHRVRFVPPVRDI